MKTRWQFWLALMLCVGLAFAVRATPKEVKQEIAVCTLYGEVDVVHAHDLIACIEIANREKSEAPIALYINSPGGSVLEGGIIIDAMQASRRPIYAIDVGYAASMSAIIFEYGTKRFMHARSVVMFHEASASFDGSMSHIDTRIILLHRILADYETHVAVLAGITPEDLRIREMAEWWLLPMDAVGQGLADAVIVESNYPPPTE
jgi:ATP-dependent Clp protease protease subunit